MKKIFAFNIGSRRVVIRKKPGPFKLTFTLEIEVGLKRWY